MNHSRDTNQSARYAPRPTVETGLWILVACIGLSVRVADLDAAPLSAPEAHQAMLSWRAVTAHDMPQTSNSPFLFAATALLFALCGPSDATARAWPALIGTVLVLTPLLLRERIGRVGSLVAGLYLALSPTAIVASRQLDGTVVAALGVMVLLGGSLRFLGDGRRFWLGLATGCAALALTAGVSAYSMLLPMGAAGMSSVRGPAERDLRGLLERLRSHWRWALIAFLGATLVLATGLGWHLVGLAAVGDSLLSWINGFGPVFHPTAIPLAVLVVYEPFALLCGLGGLVWAVVRGQRFGTMLGLWAGLGTALLSFTPGRVPLDVLGIVLPLALLTGLAVRALGQGLRMSGSWRSAGLYVPVVIVLWAYFYLILARYASSGSPVDSLLALLVVALQLLLTALFAVAMGIPTALRAFALGTGVVLLAVTVSAGWGVSHIRPADPRELLVHQPSAIGVRDLKGTLRDLSWSETGMPTTLPLTYEAGRDSVLAWYLREFSTAQRVDGLDARWVRQHRPILITMRDDLDLPDLPYAGQDFVLRRGWRPGEVACAWEWPPRCETAAGWLLFRRTPSPTSVEQRAVLWRPQDETDE